MNLRSRPHRATTDDRSDNGDATMTTHARRRYHLSSLAVAGAFLLAGLTGTVQAAGPGGPHVDDGGSGGSADAETTSMMIEELGLVPTNGGPGSFSMQQPPVLVGSGTEREEIANVYAQEKAGMLDETARSTDLIALSPDASIAQGTDTAAAQHGRPH